MNLRIAKKELTVLLKDFYIVTNFRVVVYDDNFIKLAAYPEKNCDFCSMIKRNNTLKRRCKECDFKAFSKAKDCEKPYTYTCHCGLTETISPIRINDILIGYIMFGQTISSSKKEKNKDDIISYCSEFINNTPALSKCYDLIKCKSVAQIKSAVRLMEISAYYICMNNILHIESDDQLQQISSYIDENLRNDLSVENLCRIFGIGRTKLFELSKRYYGVSITRYIKKRRINTAAKCLTQYNMNIAQTAEFCGFSDYNYFSKVFKSETGFSPSQYKNYYR